MQLLFLGTSASEGYPNAFCACENCEAARKAGGPSLRKRSAALIDGELLIDMGPDLMAASLQHGVPLANVRYCLQTHEHSDHFDPSHFSSRSPACGVLDAPRLHYYASHNALARAGFCDTLMAAMRCTPSTRSATGLPRQRSTSASSVLRSRTAR